MIFVFMFNKSANRCFSSCECSSDIHAQNLAGSHVDIGNYESDYVYVGY